jgi:hypothetical protein
MAPLWQERDGACRVQGIVATLRKTYPDMHIVLMGLMPRGAKFWLGDQDPYERWIWPNRYTPALQIVNQGYQVSQGSLMLLWHHKAFRHYTFSIYLF